MNESNWNHIVAQLTGPLFGYWMVETKPQRIPAGFAFDMTKRDGETEKLLLVPSGKAMFDIHLWQNVNEAGTYLGSIQS